MPMGSKIGTAYIDVKGDFSAFDRDLDRATGGGGKKFAALGAAAKAGFAAGAVGVGLLAKSSIDAASDINESLSKNQVLFGKSAKGVESFATRSAKAYGISKRAALEYTGTFGNLFRALGQSEQASASQSVALTKLAADMASFNNTSVEDALEAIRSGLVGETEPLRKFGVNMNDATLRTQALSMGLIKSTKDALDPQTKALAASALIAKQTSAAHGDFGRTSGSLANQQKILKARLDDASASLGAKLLPFAVKGANALNDLITSAQNGTGIFATIGRVWDSITGAFKGAGDQAGTLTTLTETLTTVAKGLVDIGAAAWRAFGSTILDQLRNLVTFAATAIEGLAKTLGGLVDLVAGVFTGDWGRAWDGVKAIFSGVWQALGAEVTYVWETIKNVTKIALTALVAIIKAAAQPFLDAGRWIIDKIVEGIKAYVGIWATVAGWLKNRIVDAIQGVRDGFVNVGGWITNRISDGIKAVTGAISGAAGWLKNRVVEFVQREVDGFQKIGAWITNRIGDGIKTVTGALTSAAGWVKNRIIDGFDAVKDGFVGLGGTLMGWLIQGLKTSANGLVGFLNVIIKLINKLPGVDIGPIAKLASGGTISSDGVQALATGGQVRRGTKLTHPTVLMGEEAPRHPEYVIPTNPAYRGRAMSLTAQLLQDIGVPLEARRGGVIGLAAGGIIGDAIKAVGNTAKGILDLPLGLIQKGASWILGQLPNPADMLPDWLVGMGKYAISKVSAWVKDKVTGLLGSSSGGLAGGGGIVALGRRLQGMGYAVSEHPAFGGVHPVHVPGSAHYAGRALDVNADNFPGGEPAALDRLYAMLQRLPGISQILWRVAGHFDHLHVAMARGGIIGAPFVGSYKDGGVVPRDGLAYVHQGETISRAGEPPVVQVFIGERELTDIVDVRVVENGRRQGAILRAGALA